MKNQILLLAFLLLTTMQAQAQVNFKCGTKPFSPFLPGFAPDNSPESGLDTATLYIPVTLHILGTDNGTDYYSAENFLESICKLNNDFKEYGFHFYLENVNYINSSAFHAMNPDTFLNKLPMFEFIENHNVPNTMNIYIVKQAGGWSFVTFDNVYDVDYSVYPYITIYTQNQSAVLDRDHLNNSDHIFTHEVGHYFGLWHTFLGDWVNDFSINGTPDITYFDVTDIITGETFTHYWLVERVDDDSTCTIAGDLICDTPPDYLSTFFPCNGDGLSEIIQTDPDGKTFRSDGTNYMSNSNCRNRFSPGQAKLMRTVAQGDRDYLLYNPTPPAPFPGTGLNLLYPPNNATISTPDSITLEWEEVPDADFYVFEFGRKVGLVHNPLLQDTLLNENSIKVGPLQNNITYYWKVSAVNKYYPCEVLTDRNYFVALVVGVEEAALQHQLRLFPNPTSERLHWRLPESGSSDEVVSVQLFDTRGQLIRYIQAPANQWIDVGNLPAGVFSIQVVAGKQVYLGKFLKQ